MMGTREASKLQLLLACAALLAGCAGWSGDDPLRTHERLNAVLWSRSAEYHASAEQAFALARLRLDEALAPTNLGWTAALEQEGDFSELPSAVIVDVDEAVLDTSDFQAEMVRNHQSFEMERWNAWVRKARATAIPGALEFVQHVAARDVRLFYLTNRSHEVEAVTRENLANLGFPVDPDGSNLLTKNEQEGWGSDKTTRRALVARDYRVLLIVGDDLNDFVSGGKSGPAQRVAYADQYRDYWGSRWIMLPNQIYGTWERSIYGYDESLSRGEILKRKWDALRGGG